MIAVTNRSCNDKNLFAGECDVVGGGPVVADRLDQVFFGVLGTPAAFTRHVQFHRSAFYRKGVVESLSEPTVSVRIHLTGRLAITHRDQLVTTSSFAGPQVALIVAILATEHHRPMSPIELADLVWVGQPPDSWRSTLRGHVSRARGTLRGIDVHLGGGDGWYQLQLPAGSTVDVIEAEREVHLAEAAARTGDAANAGRAAVITAMISAEPVLPELTHPWVDDVRERVEVYGIRALEVLTGLWIEAGHYEQAVVDAERLVELDPLRESGHELLIRAHIGMENQALALRAYERCRAVLMGEVGASPGDAIETLYEQLLASSRN